VPHHPEQTPEFFTRQLLGLIVMLATIFSHSIVGRLRHEAPGLWLMIAAVLFNAIMLAPEIRIEQVPVNDLTFHVAAAQRLGQSLTDGEPFLEPWVSEWSLGYPLWRNYQPIPHLIAAIWMVAARPLVQSAVAFALLYYLLLILAPVAIYVEARLFGVNSLAAGIAALLFLAVSEQGDFGRYGLSYGSYVWRGSGLYTQLVALELLLPALGLAARALATGKYRILTAAALAATAMSHLIFGYAAFLSVIIIALVTSRGRRSIEFTRAVTIIAIALAMIAWFVLPLLATSREVNRCIWDDSWKFDSWGASVILHALVSGCLLDADRLPVLTYALLGSVLVAAISSNLLARRLLVLTIVWLVLFFGRETWGHLLTPFGITQQFHLHRFQANFELFAILLISWALEAAISYAISQRGTTGLAIGIAIGVGAFAITAERINYLQLNAAWGNSNFAAFQKQKTNLTRALNDVRSVLARRPGRVSAGLAAGWGGNFVVGSAKVYSFLSRDHFDEASFLYHTFSLGSNVMVIRDERDQGQESLFGIRAVLAPASLAPPSDWKRIGLHGQFAVYEASPEGYYSLADIGARYDGSLARALSPYSGWLQSPMMRAGALIGIDRNITGVPIVADFDRIPIPPAYAPRGTIVSESKNDDTYQAHIITLRKCFALLKISFFPGIEATVSGHRVPVFRVYPNFCAIPLGPGDQIVEATYRPGPLKPVLFVAGILFTLVVMASLRRSWFLALEGSVARWFGEVGVLLRDERVWTACALVVFVLVLTRPLFRGMLVDGDDATEYPPRLAELAHVLADHAFPPVWAPDLGSGHGQPLFEFAPPLLYFAALPFFAVGFRLADSLQFALALLFAAGAWATYKIARRYGGSRCSSVAVSALWLFAPYVALDLYVRAAFAEAAAIAIAPVALLGVLYAVETPTLIAIVAAAGAVALVPLAHNAIALLFLPVLGLVVMRRAMSVRSFVPLVRGGLALAGGLALSAAFWIPALLEKDFVKTELLRHDFLKWTDHIISPYQLIWGWWGFGYSVPGPNDGMSFSIGLPHILLALAGLSVFRWKKRHERSDYLLLAMLALLFALLATEWSAPIWAHVTTLQYMAYPWRTLFLPALLLPLLALPAFEHFGSRFTIAALVVVLMANLSHTQPKGFLTFDDEYYYPASIAREGINTTTREEYEPKWVTERPYRSVLPVWSDDSKVSILRSVSGTRSQELDLSLDRPAHLVDSIFFYPGWAAIVDGHQVPIHVAPVTGLITFDLPAGTHHVELKLSATLIRSFAWAVSLATAVLAGVLVAFALGWMLLQPFYSRHQVARRKPRTLLIPR
jgi:hypothetical protein